MALHELNLWTFDSRTGSSLDAFDKYGGLAAGRIDLPEDYRKAKGFKVRLSGTNTLETYASLSALVTGIGGRNVGNTNGREAIIEFNTTSSTNGVRGIHAIDGIFVRDWHRDSALTKGEADKYIVSHGVDEYLWTGEQSVEHGSSMNLLSLANFSTDVTTGDSTINAATLVILPVAVKPRGILVTVTVDGEYSLQGPHDMLIQIREADGTTIVQNVPVYALDKKLNKLTATFAMYTNGVYDDLSTTGFKVQFENASTSAMTLKEVRIVVQNISNPDFSRS